MNDLKNTANFTAARSAQYAARSTMNVAIQTIRYTPLLSTAETLNASPPNYCWGSSANYVSQLDNIEGVPEIAVWCSTVWVVSSNATRVVTLSACPSTVPADNPGPTLIAARNAAAVSCAAHPLLQAVVAFNDYPPGVAPPTTGQCYVYCGATMTVNSLVPSPVVPTVSTVTTIVPGVTGPITGGTQVTITGTGFVDGSTVNFVEESGGSPANDNNVIPATNVAYVSPTSITASAPPVIQGTTFFVTVTTPTGTSAYGGSDVFTYTPVAPTLTSITPTSGPANGGLSVTMTGTGFVNGSTVSFVQESGGNAVNGGVVAAGTTPTVVSPTSITAVSPAVTVATTYLVTVTTPAGTTTSSAVFTAVPQFPAVGGVSPPTGPPGGGTPVTIRGTGFVIGASVTFVPESGGAATGAGVAADPSGTTVISANSISALTPALATATTYFVTVTTPSGTSGFNSVFTTQ